MKSTVEQLNPTRVKLTVEVPFDELKPNFDKAYRTLASQVKVPGFRQGKVPAKIIDARVGRGAVLSEVVNDAIPQKYGQALSENSIAPMGQPDIEVTEISDGQSISFTAEVDVRPQIEVPAADQVSVVVDDVVVTDADVDEQIEALRDRFATLTVVDRAAADGDLVTIDLRAAVDGDVLDDASADDLSYRIGSGDLVDGIDGAIVGLSAGESTTFVTKLVAGDHAGSDADVTVTVNTVKERQLPEVDDEFAGEASQFDTVEEMRTDLAEKVRRSKNQFQGAQARDKVLEALLAAVEIPVPEAIVKAEFENREHTIIHALGHDDAAFVAWLEEQGKTKEELDAELLSDAGNAVRTQLLLDAMAEQSGIGVTQEEFTERILFNAQRAGVSPDEYFKRVQEQDQLTAVFAEVRRAKALANAVTVATVTDQSGAVLDVQALFGFEPVPSAEEAAEAAALEAAAERDEDLANGIVDGTVDDAFDDDLDDLDDDADGSDAEDASAESGAEKDDRTTAV